MPKGKTRDVYDDLLDYYLALRQPVPNLKEAKEIVKLRFTEEEARVALNLPGWLKGGLTSKRTTLIPWISRTSAPDLITKTVLGVRNALRPVPCRLSPNTLPPGENPRKKTR